MVIILIIYSIILFACVKDYNDKKRHFLNVKDSFKTPEQLKMKNKVEEDLLNCSDNIMYCCYIGIFILAMEILDIKTSSSLEPYIY